MNADQIHTHLMKLQLNFRKGPNCNCIKKTFYVTKINAFTLFKNIVSAVEKNKPSSIRKTNGLQVSN